MNRIAQLLTIVAFVIVLFPPAYSAAISQGDIDKAKAAIKTLKDCKGKFTEKNKEKYNKCLAADKVLLPICGEHTGLMYEKRYGSKRYYAKDDEIAQCSKKVNLLKATPTKKASSDPEKEACKSYKGDALKACQKAYTASKKSGKESSAKCSSVASKNKAACNAGAKAGKAQYKKPKAKVTTKVGAGQDDIDLKPLDDVGVASPNDDTVDSIANIVFSLAGGLALLFVVIGGTRYILSRGDPQATAQAKNTIVYAIVGLLVTLLAFAIVKFVLSVLF